MVELFLFLSVIVACASGSGEFIVTHAPPSVKFSGDELLSQTLLPEIFSTSLGFTLHKGSKWHGLTVADPFNYGEAVVVLAVEGITSLGVVDDSAQTFPLETDQDEEQTWKEIKSRVVARYPTQNNTLLRTDLGVSLESLDDVSFNHLNKDVEEDSSFIQELVQLNKLIENIETYGVQTDGIPDVYWVVMHSLHMLMDVRGPDHPATLEALQNLQGSFKRLTEAFVASYHGRVLCAALVSDASHTRRSRSILQDTKSSNNNEDLNLAAETDDDFPAIFNIILWTSLALVFSLIAIAIATATMDPGRDSIIYRMTSNRMKKDN